MKGFAPGWKMTVFVAAMLPTVVSLGMWQVERGAEKRALESAYLNRLTALPVAPSDAALAKPFTRIRLQGEFRPEIYLLDNQVRDGRVGYWLIQAFAAADGRRYLVNRGFVQAPPERSLLPELSSPAGERVVVGAVWPFLGLLPVYDEDAWAAGWPKRVQRMEITRMAKEADAVAVEIRLEPGQPGVAQAAPFASVLSDAKHRGYASTWFGLALVLSVGYVIFGVRSARGELVQRTEAD